MASPNQTISYPAVERIRESAIDAATRGLIVELPINRHESLEIAEYCRDNKIYKLSLDTIEQIILTNQAVLFGVRLIVV